MRCAVAPAISHARLPHNRCAISAQRGVLRNAGDVRNRMVVVVDATQSVPRHLRHRGWCILITIVVAYATTAGPSGSDRRKSDRWSDDGDGGDKPVACAVCPGAPYTVSGYQCAASHTHRKRVRSHRDSYCLCARTHANIARARDMIKTAGNARTRAYVG